MSIEVSVRPSAPENTNQSTYSGGQGNLRYSGYTVWKLLPEAFEGASQARVWTNTPLPEGRFDVTVRQPRGHTALEAHELLWQAMQSAFALTATKTTNEVDVLLLRTGRTNGPGLTPPASRAQGFRTGIGKIEALNAPLELLAWTLEDKLNKPVIDETRITRHFDISLKWDEKRIGPDSNGFNATVANPEGLIRAVQEQLGLELLPARQPVVGFVVHKLEKAKPVTKQQ
jgi:uncharacterized protein (TIGR03435 family)